MAFKEWFLRSFGEAGANKAVRELRGDEKMLFDAFQSGSPHKHILTNSEGSMNATEFHFLLICSGLFKGRNWKSYQRPSLLDVDGMKTYEPNSDDLRTAVSEQDPRIVKDSVAFKSALSRAIQRFGVEGLPANFVEAYGKNNLDTFFKDMPRDRGGMLLQY